MLESKYTATLAKEVRHLVYYLKIHNAYQNGVPDCYYSGSIRDLWSEHKKFDTLPPVIDLTKTSVTTKLQQLWLQGRHAEGRNVSMIVFSPEGHLLLMGLDWTKPIPRDEFRKLAVDKKQLAQQLLDYLGVIKGGPDGHTTSFKF